MEGAESWSIALLSHPGHSDSGRAGSAPAQAVPAGGFVSLWVPEAGLCPAVMLIEELQCPGRLKTLKKLKGKRLSRLQPLPRTLRLLGLLQLDENHRVSKAATACLARAGGSGALRAQVSGDSGDSGDSRERGTAGSFPLERHRLLRLLLAGNEPPNTAVLE